MARAIDECRGPGRGRVRRRRVRPARRHRRRVGADRAPAVGGGAGDVRGGRRPPADRASRASATARSRTITRAIDAVTALGGEVALVVRARGRHRCRVPTRARRARPPPRSVRGVHRSPRPQRSPARAAPRCARSARASRARKGSSTWLGGIDDLVDRGQAGAFVASRLAYRRLLRRSGWLIVPALVGLALFWSFFELTGRRTNGSALVRVFRLLGAGLALEFAVVGVVLVFTVTQLHDALGGVAWWGSQSRGNDDARGEAVTLASAGGVGLVTAYTRRPELTDLGGGSFYANCGSGGRVVERVEARAGLPPVFVERLRCSWVELEAGAELHARLWHGVRDLPTSHVDRSGSSARDRRPAGVAAAKSSPRHPGTVTWPSAGDATALRRRTRRIAATAIASAGVINLASAVTLPLASRLGALRRFAPIAVPEAAAVLVALAGVGLLFLARGVRRGQRHAWSLALALLLVSVGGHVVKGLDIEEAIAHAARGGVPRDASRRLRRARQPDVGAARGDRPRFVGVVGRDRRPASVGVELHRPRLPLGHAFGAVVAPAVRRPVGRAAAPPRHGSSRRRCSRSASGSRCRCCWLSFRPAVVAAHVVVPSDVARPGAVPRGALRLRLALVLRAPLRQGVVRLPRHGRRVPRAQRHRARVARSGRPGVAARRRVGGVPRVRRRARLVGRGDGRVRRLAAGVRRERHARPLHRRRGRRRRRAGSASTASRTRACASRCRRVRKAGYRVEMFDPAQARARAGAAAPRSHDREPAGRRRARVLDDARARVRARRPRAAARGRVRRATTARPRSASTCPRGRSPVGRSTSCGAPSASEHPERAHRARRRRHDRASAPARATSDWRSTSRRSAPCSRARPAIGSCTGSRSGSSSG